MRRRRRTTWPILISCLRSTTSGPLLESLSNFGPLQKKHLHIASNIKINKSSNIPPRIKWRRSWGTCKICSTDNSRLSTGTAAPDIWKNIWTKTAMRATADHAYLSFLSLPLFLWIDHFSLSTCDRWLVPDVDELRPYQSPAGNQLPLWIRVGDTASFKKINIFLNEYSGQTKN